MNKLRVFLFAIAVIIFGFNILIGNCNAGEASSPKIIKLKATATFPKGHPANVSIIDWVKKVEERSKGRISITLYEGTLGSSREFYDMCTGGIVDVISFGPAVEAARLPLLGGMELPMEVSGPALGSAVYYALLDAGYLDAELKPFKLLYIASPGTMNLFMRDKKVNSLEDLSGLKIKAPGGPIYTGTIKGLGGSAAQVSREEEYIALERGVIDCLVTGADNFVSGKFYEIAKYALKQPPMTCGSMVALMSKNTWNSLPPDLQEMINKVNTDVYEGWLQSKKEQDKGFWAKLDTEMEVYSLDPKEEARWRKAVQPVIENWIVSMEAKGLPARKSVELMRKVVSQHGGK